MKIRTSLRAGGTGCSPETQNYMQKAVNMQNKVYNCTKGTAAPIYGYYPPYFSYVVPSTSTATTPTYSQSSVTYPDMSGVCG